MSKNIVILCDGTSNEISENRTNVLRLYGTLAKTPDQIVYYDPGVGTFGAANAWSYYYRKTAEVWGLATGWGLDQNVKQCYRFLVDHYDDGKRPEGTENEKPDQIYIFGFSRGAYTARVLAGFIHAVGLIKPLNENLIDYAYRAYKGISDRSEDDPGGAFAEVRLYERILDPRRPVIRCLGLFDTVSSVIEFGRNGIRLRSHAFTRTNPSVQSVRHALSIDERRTMFQPQLWPTDGKYKRNRFQRTDGVDQDVKEVWFTGVHGDVGGGYPEAKSGLAKIPLEWMIDETGPLGLTYDTRTVNNIVRATHKDSTYVKPNPLAPPNQSMNFAWSVLEYLPRRVSPFHPPERPTFMGWYVPYFSPRQIPDGAVIHPSVFERRGTPEDFPQPNIPDDHSVYVPPKKPRKR